jgi:excisionase family DNA binding protein
MPAVIRQHIRYPALLKSEAEELTSAEAARLAGVSTQAVRDWCHAYGIGAWSPRLKAYLIDRRKLETFLEKRRRRFA